MSLTLALRDLAFARRDNATALKKEEAECRRTLLAVAGPAAAGDIVARATRERVSKRLKHLEDMR